MRALLITEIDCSVVARGAPAAQDIFAGSSGSGLGGRSGQAGSAYVAGASPGGASAQHGFRAQGGVSHAGSAAGGARCATACAGLGIWRGEVCVIDCTMPGACPSQVTCPIGVACGGVSSRWDSQCIGMSGCRELHGNLSPCAN
jgi:hypothetical protein